MTKASTAVMVRTKSSNAKVYKASEKLVYLHIKKVEYHPKAYHIKVELYHKL